MQRTIPHQAENSANTYTEQDLHDEQEEAGNFALEELPNNYYKLTMHIAQCFYGGLIGSRGATKRRIEAETRTNIYVPRNREGDAQKQIEDVSIKGKSRNTVMAAYRKINLLIISLRKRMRPTHFTCVPLNYGEVRERYCEWKKEILALNLPGIEENLFQSEACIHLTISTCVLLDDAERAKAAEILQNYRPFLDGLRTPFQIAVCGLEIMNDDPSAVRILYGRIESPELQKFTDLAIQPFLRSGLGFDYYERGEVKLHMTAMNNRYRKQLDASAAGTFDAREILKHFGDYNFGKVECSEVHLCLMHEENEEKGSFYKITGTLTF